ncbi:MAG: MoaD/ThiS family protein [Candidatus Caldarchaeum sp.]|nr:MoaD/ThiS family protein [Candidatus Caldarchaeum sp.]MDW7978595.1 MoaD/ThiS family protein [Candidatus Caldarchaeum sp.]
MDCLVRVELLGPLRSAVGVKEITLRVEGRRRLREVIALLDEKIRRHVVDESGAPQPGILVLVNGEDVRYFSWLDTEVDDDDTLTLIPSIHGGLHAGC